MVMYDDRHKCVFAHAVPSKGAGDGWIIEQLYNDIEQLGYTKIIIKCDQEPSIMNIQSGIKDMRSHETILENTPVRSSQSNGAVEQAIGTVMGQVRVMKSCLESSIKNEDITR